MMIFFPRPHVHVILSQAKQMKYWPHETITFKEKNAAVCARAHSDGHLKRNHALIFSAEGHAFAKPPMLPHVISRRRVSASQRRTCTALSTLAQPCEFIHELLNMASSACKRSNDYTHEALSLSCSEGGATRGPFAKLEQAASAEPSEKE